MALSEHEQRLLDEMERGFYRSEADVVETGSVTRRRLNYRSLVLGIVVMLVGIGALVAGVAAQQLWLGLIGFAAMVGGVLLMMSRGSETDEIGDDARRVKRGGPQAQPSESFSERMERRWNERMGEDS
ncbi:DUF3040 domain-containing protein [Leucobacter sp. gxy201]|uniref:DUF3040 domain-containing protein n=1 Tax=Leucobacter sp. gxy201 TaxID=2957200 RepID=UPI003D9FB8AC